jgi:hypothetical protein
MTADPNGWPDPARPGVPENPEKSGSHWVLDANGDEVVADWCADVQRWGRWPYTSPADFAQDNTYVARCLTPQEVAAERDALAQTLRGAQITVDGLIGERERTARAALARGMREGMKQAAQIALQAWVMHPATGGYEIAAAILRGCAQEIEP